MVVVCVGIGAPVMFGAVPAAVPQWVWTAVFLCSLAAAFAAVWSGHVSPPGRRSRVIALAAYGVAVAASSAAVLLAPSAGWLPILLVFHAALGVYLVPPAGVAGVIAWNTLVLFVLFSMQSARPGEVVLSTGLYLLIQIASAFSTGALVREQRTRASLAAANVELRAANALLAESARTAERLRISRELHDLIGHQLTVLTLELEAAKHRDGRAAREHVERADGVARGLLADVRATVGRLRESGTGELAELLGDVVAGIPGLEIALDVPTGLTTDDDETAALVRAVQEIATNTLRHAEATRLEIRVSRDAAGIRLTALDDGRGAGRPVAGNGLRGLQERFAALGGDVSFDGAHGFRVEARVPAR
ncbi:two-component sensor histidine kinase [Agromyces archimandritae]|uniref:Two-component sensor histidine kinase n=2 Tax=Agromyces archimandritae TaxID=2781962 RepID=A0A975FS03_9MICO|nr:two-component sensor histidine kinase [Agromyces archimandritae]